MYNQHVNHCYYGVNQDLSVGNSSQVQDHVYAATQTVSHFSARNHVQQLASPPLEQQEEIVWYNPRPQIGNDFDALTSTFGGHNELSNSQEVVLFNLLQYQQQPNHQQVGCHDSQQLHYHSNQQIDCHDNQLFQFDEQELSLNEWVLVSTDFQQNNINLQANGALPLSPMSMQSADNFDSSPIMGGSSHSQSMYAQTSPTPARVPERQYYRHQLIFNNSNPDMFASQSSNEYNNAQEMAQLRYQLEQQQQQHQEHQEHQYHQKQQQPQQQQQQPKQSKKTTRRRTSRSQLQCATCFKTFSRPYNLKSHQRTHTKERPFKCLYPECGWTFARPHDLKRHDLLHSGIKPFECVCGKKFARSDAYKRHQSVDINCAISALPPIQRKRPNNLAL